MNEFKKEDSAVNKVFDV